LAEARLDEVATCEQLSWTEVVLSHGPAQGQSTAV